MSCYGPLLRPRTEARCACRRHPQPAHTTHLYTINYLTDSNAIRYFFTDGNGYDIYRFKTLKQKYHISSDPDALWQTRGCDEGDWVIALLIDRHFQSFKKIVIYILGRNGGCGHAVSMKTIRTDIIRIIWSLTWLSNAWS